VIDRDVDRVVWPRGRILDMPVGTSGTSTLGDFLTTDVASAVQAWYRQLEAKELNLAIRNALQKLKPDRAHSARPALRSGCDDEAEKMVKEKDWARQERTAFGEGLLLKQVGDLFHLSDERIRQLESRR